MKVLWKVFSFLFAALFLCVNLCFCAAASGTDTPIDKSEFEVSKADNWTDLFFHPNETQKTWLGADGIYSVALNGNDAFASADASTTTFFIFSDTLMGTSDNRGHLIENAGMPSTTSAYLKGNLPDDSNIQYVYGNGGSMAMGGQNLFGERLWMLDCLVLNNNIYCFGFTPSGDWKPENLKVAVIPVKNSNPNYASYVDPVDVSSHLWYRDRNYLYAYGVGVFNNTAEAGAPNPDGYIYLYGYRDALRESSRKDMIISRIKASDFPTYTYDPDNKHNYKPDFSKIEYFDGQGWSKDIAKSAPLISAVSCEFSVSPIPSGKYADKYIAVYTHNTEGNEICYAIGDTPYGPFETPRIFYHAPEHGQTGTSGYGTRYVYNAKAHPHLSKDGKLLVSYNCNVRDVMMNDQTSADYHPRFLWLDLGDSEDSPDTLTSSVFPIMNNTIRVPGGTTAETLKAGLNEKDYVVLSETGKAKTGMTVTLSGHIVYTVVMVGDVNGDGDVTAVDLTRQAIHISRISLLTSAPALSAADIDGDEITNAADLTSLARTLASIQ